MLIKVTWDIFQFVRNENTKNEHAKDQKKENLKKKYKEKGEQF